MILPEEIIRKWLAPESYILLHTSGSTGEPKEIQLQKSLIKASALRTIKCFDIKPGDLLVSCVNLKFVGGMMIPIRAHIAGARCIALEPSNSPEIPDTKIKLLACVPSQLPHILEFISSGKAQIEHILVGGAPLSNSIQLPEGVNVWESYGMTEAASHIALKRAGERFFHPLSGIKVRCTEDSRLVIELDADNTLVTNDLVGEMKKDSSFTIVGRADDVIISGGLKLHPAKMEEQIRHLVTGDFLISSKPDPKWGERIVLVTTSPQREDLLQKIGTVVDKWQIPKEIIEIEEIPKTESGKPSRRKLKEILSR